MVVGVLLSGVIAGLTAATMAVIVGQAPVSVGLVYCLAGLIGSTLFILTALLRNPADCLRPDLDG